MGQGRNLGVGINRKIVDGIKFGDSATGTHTTVRNPGRAETIFNHIGRRFPGSIHIAIMQFPRHSEHIGLMRLVHQGSTFLHGFLRIENTGQRLIDHLDQAYGFFGYIRIGCRHSGDFIPVRTDLTGLQRPVILVYAHFYFRTILPGDNRPDPRQRPGFSCINFYDPGMGKLTV